MFGGSSSHSTPTLQRESSAPSVPPRRAPAAATAPTAATRTTTETSGAVLAPLPGLILKVQVKEGDAVQAGQPLLVMEAMKMEHRLTSDTDATVLEAVRNVQAMEEELVGIDATDRMLQKTPFSFDVSVWEFFWPLICGAALVVARPGGHRDPDYLVDTIRRERITTIHFVPSMLAAFLAVGLVASACVTATRDDGPDDVEGAASPAPGASATAGGSRSTPCRRARWRSPSARALESRLSSTTPTPSPRT